MAALCLTRSKLTYNVLTWTCSTPLQYRRSTCPALRYSQGLVVWRIAHDRRIVGIRYYHSLRSSALHHCSCTYHKISRCAVNRSGHFTLPCTAWKFMRKWKFAAALQPCSFRVEKKPLVRGHLQIHTALYYLLFSTSRISRWTFWKVILSCFNLWSIGGNAIILNLNIFDARMQRLLIILQNYSLFLLLFLICLGKRHSKFFHIL